jgi:hypothetical protein
MELNIGNKRIEQLFAKFFGLDSSYIHQCYREFKDAYNQALNQQHSTYQDGFIPKQKQSWKIRFQEQQTMNHWENSTLIGVDLPLFFKCPEPEAKTVMLVAQDPLRNPLEFPDFNKHEDVIIGTPFAFHNSKSMQAKENTKLVLALIKNIVAKNYHVYVTDIYKVWMKDDDKKPKNVGHALTKESKIFEQLLREELDIIDPKIIITLGNKARNAYRNISKNFAPETQKLHKPLTHPSPSAGGKWSELIGKGKTVWDRLEYLNNKIDKYLD